jgi:hypothetical protein
MTTYPEEFKAKIIAQLLPPHNRNIPELARRPAFPLTHFMAGVGRASQQRGAP